MPRRLGLVAALALAVGVLGQPAHAATPVYPAADDVARSTAQVRANVGQVGRLEAELAGATARSAQLGTRAAQAAEAYNGARVRLSRAIVAGGAAQRRVEVARGRVRSARRSLGAFAAAAYRSGGDLTGLSAFLAADGPRDLLDRASAMDEIGDSRRHALDGVRSRQVHAGVLERRAAASVAAQRSAAVAVRHAKDRAAGASAAQQRAVARLGARREVVIQRLALARHTTASLERSRQAGIRREQEALTLAAELRRQDALRRAAAVQAAADERTRAARAARDAQAVRDAQARAAHDAEAAQAAQQAEDTRAAHDAEAAQAAQQAKDTQAAHDAEAAQAAQDDPPTGASTGSRAGAAMAIEFARAQMGKPYEWGAGGPGTFDCSGLVMRAWQAGGVELPHFSVAQYEQGEKIALGDLLPGDLVFFGSSTSSAGSIYHVGLYIGDGQMIEAPYTGENVRISSIYRDSLFGAARP